MNRKSKPLPGIKKENLPWVQKSKAAPWDLNTEGILRVKKAKPPLGIKGHRHPGTLQLGDIIKNLRIETLRQGDPGVFINDIARFRVLSQCRAKKGEDNAEKSEMLHL